MQEIMENLNAFCNMHSVETQYKCVFGWWAKPPLVPHCRVGSPEVEVCVLN
jgi:hypothetical protein